MPWPSASALYVASACVPQARFIALLFLFPILFK